MRKMINKEETKWADPTMGQLLSVGISSVLIWTVLIGLVEEHFLPIVGLWFGCTAIYSFVAGLINLRRGEMFNGVLQSFFGIFFFLGFGLTFIYGFDKGIDFTPFLGYILTLLGIVLSAFTLGVWKISKLVGISLIFFDAGLLIQGILNLAGMYLESSLFGGWLIGIAGFVMIFSGLVLVVSTAIDKEI